LTSVGGAADVNGAAAVTQTAPGVFDVAFAGGLGGFDQPLMTAAVTAGPGGVAVAEKTKGTGGTVVANGASLQLAGSFTVAGEPLLVNGAGGGAAPSVPTQW